MHSPDAYLSSATGACGCRVFSRIVPLLRDSCTQSTIACSDFHAVQHPCFPPGLATRNKTEIVPFDFRTRVLRLEQQGPGFTAVSWFHGSVLVYYRGADILFLLKKTVEVQFDNQALHGAGFGSAFYCCVLCLTVLCGIASTPVL